MRIWTPYSLAPFSVNAQMRGTRAQVQILGQGQRLPELVVTVRLPGNQLRLEDADFVTFLKLAASPCFHS